MITQNFDTEQNILFVKNSGRLEFESMKTYFSSLKDYTDNTQTLFVLEDAREVKVKFTSEHLLRLSKILTKVAQSYDYVYHAVILEERTDVAYAMMISDGVGAKNYHLKVFSDSILAMEWVKNK